MKIKPVLLLLLISGCLRAEDGSAAWLRYQHIDSGAQALTNGVPAAVVALNPSLVEQTAQQELIRGVEGMLGRTLRIDTQLPSEDCIVLGTLSAVRPVLSGVNLPDHLIDDAYLLKTAVLHGHNLLLITASNQRGVLYGTFAFLRKLALQEQITQLDEQSAPYAPVRWTNEWDNLDGSIERGYAGRSIFFSGGKVVDDLSRAAAYARLLASIGINGCAVNNVNANPLVLSPEFLPQLARIAAAFRPWGVRLSIAVDFSSPKTIGHLDTFDPVDPKVAAWWRGKADELYQQIPDLGGILLKADSEGRVGPSTYGRTHAEAANVIARALRPHGGILIYRGFVYNHNMDWRDLKNDRARAAYDNFATLDGQFDDNVLVQVKYGPIDFQVREPVSPLLGALQKTNQTIEFQVTQEYTGQQRHLCFLLPLWTEILNTDMRVNNRQAFVKDVAAGKTFHRPMGGFVAVSNVGLDVNWLGYDLAMANLYAFGRIAWDADLTAPQIADEWTRLTFGPNPKIVQTINHLQLSSWRTYEDYTGPLGAGGLTDIAGDAQGIYIGSHYGPGIESSEHNGWGQWHRADKEGIGMDRTAATGTGYTGQYAPELAAIYESLERCPDNLLLFFHHVSYRHVLHSGQTVIQYIYDSHYAGAAAAQTFPEQWRQLRGLIDADRYHAVLRKLEYQAGHAIVWRDTVCDWFLRESGIADAHGRVGYHPDRTEAENLTLNGYLVTDVSPWEDASNGKAITCQLARCTGSEIFHGKAGWYNLAVQYFDQNNGNSRFQVYVNTQCVASWTADQWLPTRKPDANSSTRREIADLALRPGDTIRITGVPDGGERAPIDYIEITPTIPWHADPATAAWVGSWAASQQIPEPRNALAAEDLHEATLRQIVHLSSGGRHVRVRLSNVFGTAPLLLASVHIGRAVSPASAAIQDGSDQTLLFQGRPDVTIPAGAEYLSDPLVYPVAPFDNLAVSIYFRQAPAQQTGHPGSRAVSYLVHGNQTAAVDLPAARPIEHWYQLSGVDVSSDTASASIIVLGDSITDGHGATTNGNDRWPDTLATRLPGMGVLNEGIGGNHVLTDGLGPNALSRFDRDVLALTGAHFLILLEGVNDLGGLTLTKEASPAEHEALVRQLIAAYRQMIDRAHAHQIKAIGATILPYAGSHYYHPGPANEADRQAVNAWIRASNHFDAVIDFDRTTRDPDHPDHLLPAFDSGDHLHPSVAGYQAMANSIDLSLFAASPKP